MIELQTLVDFLQAYSYTAVFGVLILCGLGLPIPEDISLVAGGIISGLGYSNVHFMLIVCMIGVLGGDSIVYNIGRRSGSRLMSSRFGKKLTGSRKYPLIEKWFENHGRKFLFAARFMPGLRAPIFFYTGATKIVSFPRFIIIDGFAALISVPVWIYLGYFGANNRTWLMDMIHRSQFGILIALGVFIFTLFFMKFIKKRVFSFVGRKSAAGAIANNNMAEGNVEG